MSEYPSRIPLVVKLLLIVVFFELSFLFVIMVHLRGVIAVDQPQTTKQAVIVPKVNHSLPLRLIVPAINIDAKIQDVGVTKKGEMDVPNNTKDVGWFDLGPTPGEIGSAVIDGHLDGYNNEVGVFTNLNKLAPGDKIYIQDSRGALFEFVVRKSLVYKPGLEDDVFSPKDLAHLNLVTCDGIWDGTKKSYTQRLVVFTDLVGQP